MSLFHTSGNDEAPVGDDVAKPADATAPAAEGEEKTEEPTATPANG